MKKEHIIVPTLIVSIVGIVGLVICFLASIGYNARLTYSTTKEKIEVQAENSNSIR